MEKYIACSARATHCAEPQVMDSLNSTDQLTLAILQNIAVNGEVTISNRKLAEHIGRTQETANKSLQRLMGAEEIGHIATGKGVRSGRYLVPAVDENLRRTLTKIQPFLGVAQGMPDLFRTPDLHGAGLLFEAAPKGQAMTVTEVLGLGVTRSRNGAVAQMERLAGLPAPLVSKCPDPAHKQRTLWTFHELTAAAELTNLECLDERLPQYRPKYRLDQEHKHFMEQEQYRERLGLEPYSVIADRDILPRVVRQIVSWSKMDTECTVFLGPTNHDGYGIVHPEWMGVGVHKVVWYVERGPVPSGHELHHDCEVRRCVNVDHLQPLTRAEHEAAHHGHSVSE